MKLFLIIHQYKILRNKKIGRPRQYYKPYNLFLLCGYSPVRVATPFYTVRKFIIMRRLKRGCCPSETLSVSEGRNSHTIALFALFY